MLSALLQVGASSFGQSVTIKRKKISLDEVFREIRYQTGYDVFLVSSNVKSSEIVDVNFINLPLTEVLEKLLENRQMDYTIDQKTVVIREKYTNTLKKSGNLIYSIEVRGRVLDDQKKPLEKATVKIKGTAKSTLTNSNGEFLLQDVDESSVVSISYLGYQTIELKARPNLGIVMLELNKIKLDEVAVNTGMFTRDKRIFTGAQATFSGQELRQLGNLNILQSLKTLDPSFIISPDNLLGSNPNQLPKIEVRGKTSLSTSTVRDQFSTDPNQPLFILNGMETTIQQIVDLDINRVASITLLKDAASTALYGSRAANGVLVVETIRPKAGKLSLSYNNSTRLEIPALGDYNMMNAEENLEFQKQAGLYQNVIGNFSLYLDNLYNQRLKAVKSGIDSYWLNEPLRNSVTQSHSLSVNGGSEDLLYNIGLSYRKLNGVMKGSDRQTPAGSIDLSYRKGSLNVSNQLYVNGYTSNESPYGSFAQFVNLNPYYTKNNADGTLNTNKYLETYFLARNINVTPINVGNPLYNATLNSSNTSSNINIQNTLSTIWDFAQNWRFSSGFQIQKGITSSILFIPSANTSFATVDFYRRGTYRDQRREDNSYQANTMLTYQKVIKNLHSLTGNIRTEIGHQKSTSTAFAAEGFPEGVNANPSFAYGYQQNQKPSYASSTLRRLNALISGNYAYDGRYYVDANFRVDGSTSFGSQNKYSTFWSIGLGWTLSREKWFNESGWLSMLRIRGNIGTTGNQSIGSYVSSSIYNYENNLNTYGQGLYLSQLGNPNLEWQNTTSTSVGIDGVFWNNRLNFTLNAYRKVSSPLVTNASVPTSSGVTTYALNIGELNTKGAEAIVRFSPIYDLNNNITWTLGYTASIYKSEYMGFSNLLKNLNEDAQKNNQLQRYLDGYSPDELWAVTSMGIDPSTGNEVFLKKNGELTFVYDPVDATAQGEGRPVLQGVISSNLNIKGFLFGINLRYSRGARIFNSALYNKVENITLAGLSNNQDKRALELRWQQPGDQAQFKSISINTTTPISSRFIQKENFLSGESINVGYDFQASKHPWIEKVGVRSMRLNAYMNDIFRLSNIKAERGIDYPFSNAVSFSINLFF